MHWWFFIKIKLQVHFEHYDKYNIANKDLSFKKLKVRANMTQTKEVGEAHYMKMKYTNCRLQIAAKLFTEAPSWDALGEFNVHHDQKYCNFTCFHGHDEIIP